VRQASLYHHFKTKDDILSALLHQTVAPTLSFISSVLSAQPTLTPTEYVHALAMFDGAQLLHSRWNLGALYLLPELRGARLASFWADRERLRSHYQGASRAVIVATGIPDAAADLPFRLVESLVNIRTKPTSSDLSSLPEHVADACIRVLGVSNGAIEGLRARSRIAADRFDTAQRH
jgi:AcrR family transcriptional regulator